MKLISIFFEEMRDTWRRPARIAGLFDRKRVRRYFVSFYLRLRYGTRWSGGKGGQLGRRTYRSYADYIEHQRSKMKYGLIDLADHDVKYPAILKRRVTSQPIEWRGKKVLCLAARLGTEVKAFLDLGCFAVGTDIEPGLNNKYVVYGDFHDIQYAPESVDVVFTNAIDHAFDMPKVIAEARRVLRPEGLLILEVPRGSAEGLKPLFFESLEWARADDLVPIVEREGFTLTHALPFDDYTYPGVQFYFTATRASGTESTVRNQG